MNLGKAAAHPQGWEGWRDDAYYEVAALLRLRGVPGVVAYRDILVEPKNAIYIIMESVPLCFPSSKSGVFTKQG